MTRRDGHEGSGDHAQMMMTTRVKRGEGNGTEMLTAYIASWRRVSRYKPASADAWIGVSEQPVREHTYTYMRNVIICAR